MINPIDWVFEKLLARKVERVLKDAGSVADADEDEGEEWDNEFLAPEIAQAIYEQFDHALHALWPVLAADPESASNITYTVMGSVLEGFVDFESDEELTGCVVEIARLVWSHTPVGFSVDDLPAVKVIEQYDDVVKFRVAKVAAFVDAVLNGDIASAIRVVDAHLADFEDRVERYGHLVGIFSLILINTSWVHAHATYSVSEDE